MVKRLLCKHPKGFIKERVRGGLALDYTYVNKYVCPVCGKVGNRKMNKGIIGVVLVLILMGCNILNSNDDIIMETPVADEVEVIDVYFTFAQSNGNEPWVNGIRDEIYNINPKAKIVHVNHPGSSIVGWYNASGLYDNYYKDLNKIRESIEGVNYNIAGMFCFQGESDSDNDDYEEFFLNIVEAYKEDLGDDDFNVFISIVHSEDLDFTKIRQIQNKLIVRNGYYGIDSMYYERKADGLHLLLEEARQLGRDTVLMYKDLF